MESRTLSKTGFLVAAGGLLALAFAAWSYLRPTAPVEPIAKVTIAVPTQLNGAPMIVASAQGLFKKTGIEVVSQPFLLGKDALKSMPEGQADLAVVADTPFMF